LMSKLRIFSTIFEVTGLSLTSTNGSLSGYLRAISYLDRPAKGRTFYLQRRRAIQVRRRSDMKSELSSVKIRFDLSQPLTPLAFSVGVSSRKSQRKCLVGELRRARHHARVNRFVQRFLATLSCDLVCVRHVTESSPSWESRAGLQNRAGQAVRRGRQRCDGPLHRRQP
jgi:hypothetical protein